MRADDWLGTAGTALMVFAVVRLHRAHEEGWVTPMMLSASAGTRYRIPKSVHPPLQHQSDLNKRSCVMDTPIFNDLRTERQFMCQACTDMNYPYRFFVCVGDGLCD